MVELASQEIIASLMLQAARVKPPASSRRGISLAGGPEEQQEFPSAVGRDAIAATAGSASTRRDGNASSRTSSQTPNTTPAPMCAVRPLW